LILEDKKRLVSKKMLMNISHLRFSTVVFNHIVLFCNYFDFPVFIDSQPLFTFFYCFYFFIIFLIYLQVVKVKA
jgi:hypothetical protein